jgi:hypothetical protein
VLDDGVILRSQAVLVARRSTVDERANALLAKIAAHIREP